MLCYGYNLCLIYLKNLENGSKRYGFAKRCRRGDLAEILGMYPTYISGIERGVCNMALKNIERLAKTLGVSIEKLMK